MVKEEIYFVFISILPFHDSAVNNNALMTVNDGSTISKIVILPWYLGYNLHTRQLKEKRKPACSPPSNRGHQEIDINIFSIS